jgi:phosphohistidine phosphatase
MLLRHAKSDWPDVPDRDRPLAKRGRRDAPVVGRWLHDRGYRPEIVICSAALRTRQTWDLVAPELGGSPSVTFEPRAYAASAITLLYLVRELPAGCQAALLIGHNPGVSELASNLLEAAGDSASGDSASGEGVPGDGVPGSPGLRFPTAAVAVLEFDGDWAGLALARARLVAYTSPGDL